MYPENKIGTGAFNRILPAGCGIALCYGYQIPCPEK
jgi:hypothetical protein